MSFPNGRSGPQLVDNVSVSARSSPALPSAAVSALNFLTLSRVTTLVSLATSVWSAMVTGSTENGLSGHTHVAVLFEFEKLVAALPDVEVHADVLSTTKLVNMSVVVHVKMVTGATVLGARGPRLVVTAAASVSC